jgi:hypothetical protein
MDDERTTVVSAPAPGEAAPGWSVYRVRTANSTYTLAIQRAAVRPCAILTNYRFVTHGAAPCEGQDTAPLAGDRPLLDLPYKEWIGHALHVGTVSTSPVRSVDPESDVEVLHTITRGVSPPPVPKAPAEDVPADEHYARIAESIARRLHFLYAEGPTLEIVRGQPERMRRVTQSLDEARLMLQALHGRVSGGR